jgi:mannose-6-phosphate isomerase-like protein (cupin superfamily)
MEWKVTGAEQSRSNRIEESWGALQWLAGGRIRNASGLTLGRVLIKRNESNPRHAHFNCEEVLYLMTGELEHTVGSGRVLLQAGDTLTVPAGMFHSARSVGQVDADMIVAYSSADRDFVLEQK